MQLKNKVERERFLEEYKDWELWKEIPELELKFYRKVLPNGTVIIATEHACMRFDSFSPRGNKYKKARDVKYHLLLAKDDEYKVEYLEHAYKLYNPSGDSKTAIVEYLTKTKPDIEKHYDNKW